MIKFWIISGICILMLVFAEEGSFAQKVYYDVFLSEKVIGEISITHVTSGTSESYEIISNVDFKVLFKSYNRKTINNIVYKNGVVYKSFNSVYMNKEMEDSSAIFLNQNKYSCYRSPDDRFTIEDVNLDFTTVKLYFQEPLGRNSVYSERFLDHCRLELIDTHKYKIHLPNGKHNYYTYVNGKLAEVLVDRTWFNLIFRPRKS